MTEVGNGGRRDREISPGPARPHESAEAHVTGRAVFTDDQVRPTGQLTAWPVLSPHAHARILGVDPAAALAIPGVVAVLGPDDVPGVNDATGHAHDEELLPTTVVHHHGQPVTWVVAETDAAAQAGAAAVEVRYEPLPAVLGVDAAEAAGSWLTAPQVMATGDVDAALAAAPHVLTGEVRCGAQDHFYLETQTAWAHIDAEGHVAVTSSTQHPSETQAVVANVLGVPRHRVVVTCPRMGGAFGGKESQANPVAAIAAVAAVRTGRPVRVRLKRDADMLATGKRHPFRGRYRVGVDDDGRMLALDAELVSDGGWSLDLSAPVTGRAMFHVDNAYHYPALRVTGRVARTNTVSHTAFRGFGGPQGMLVGEDVVDRVARHLGLAPELVRERNLYRPGRDLTHYGQRVPDDRLRILWGRLAADARVAERRREFVAANRASPHLKRGLAMTPVKFGISFTKTQYNQAGAYVLIYLDGSVQVNHGGTEMGQGLHSKILEVAARTLGIGVERIRPMPTATDKVPNTSATAASSGTDLNGQAVRAACETLRKRLAGLAGSLLGAPDAGLTFTRGRIHVTGDPARGLAFDEVVAQAYEAFVPLAATGYYRTPGIGWDAATGRGTPFHYYASGAAVSEVEVDGWTGEWRLLAVDILHDVGESLNPLVDRGQIEGGFVQGMGWLTSEECVWDADGRLRTHAPSTYKIPTIGEVPEDVRVRFLSEVVPGMAQEGVVLGSKAVGEPPFMLALSVREALRDAVGAFAGADRADRCRVDLAAPATPEALLRAVDAVRSGTGSPIREPAPA
ncbi:MAG: xanthine dehydrogenase molybdopterin binding subunit [Kineosporiaceae bacterium]